MQCIGLSLSFQNSDLGSRLRCVCCALRMCCPFRTEYYTKVSKGWGQMPAVFIIYDMFSLAVAVTDSRRSLLHFLVRVCAVLGGVFAVTGEFAIKPNLIQQTTVLSCCHAANSGQ